jgi:transcriptional regulator with GAF, ATPase, and Fis domain
MSDSLLHDGLRDLLDPANRIAPTMSVGVVRRENAGRLLIVFSQALGIGGHGMTEAEAPEWFLPPLPAAQHVPGSAFEINPDAPAQASMRFRQTGSLAVVPLHGTPSPTLVWFGLRDDVPADAAQLAAFQSLAAPLAGMLSAPEPRPRELDRLRRQESVMPLLPALFDVLDVRDVFERLGHIARPVLPHDMFVLPIFSDDLREVTVYAHSGLPGDIPRTVANTYPLALAASWEYQVLHDLSAHPAEKLRNPARMGYRSSIRVPIRLGTRLRGALDFLSFTPSCYSIEDVRICRQVADVVALALSHQRLAEESRRSAALRERAANLETLDELLNALSGVLDIRDVFDRVSAIARKVFPHDAMVVREMLDDPTQARNYALTGIGELHVPDVSAVTETQLLTSPWDHFIIDDLSQRSGYASSPLVKAGLHSLLSLPIRAADGRLIASVSFLSQRTARFNREDVLLGRRIADHIALAFSHKRLSDEQRHREEVRSRAAKLDLLDDLLATVTSAGELPDVFARVSAIAQKVLPHDALTMPVLLPNRRQARVYAYQTPDSARFPDIVEVPAKLVADQEWEYDLVDDVRALPDQRNMETARMGYRGVLRIPIRLDGDLVAGLSFLSFTPSRYTTADVPVARRIADRLAVNLWRERGHDEARRAEEATARAARLEARMQALTEELDARSGYRRVIGRSTRWRQVLTQAMQVAATDTTVLLLGESGTGKEVAARFVHRGSPRRNGPFLALNCAALPEQLLEAELFGYERGAFTGAMQSKPGQLEQAAGGTLFLDEVGEMSPSAQAKFLRVLQEREFQRLGGTKVLRTEARIVAATNRDLQKAMEAGVFREDLFYRLNVFAIHLPALRERRDDILPLADAFVSEFGRTLGRPPGGISREARQALLDYRWPGNVRELRNVLERAAILCDGGLITSEHLALRQAPSARPAASAPHAPAGAMPVGTATPQPPAGGTLHSVERAMIEKVLQDSRFNKSVAAKTLGLTRAQLYVRLRKYGLE